MKKKLSVLAALATVVTVGGVYANWTYAQKTAESHNRELLVSLTDVNTQAEAGVISVVLTGSLKVDDSNGDYVAELEYRDNPTIAIMFTPTTDANVEMDKVLINYTISIETPFTPVDGMTEFDYTGKDTDAPVLTMATVSDTLTFADDHDSSGRIVATLNVNQLGLTLAEGIKLDTKAKYDHFAKILENGKINITVTQTWVDGYIPTP